MVRFKSKELLPVYCVHLLIVQSFFFVSTSLVNFCVVVLVLWSLDIDCVADKDRHVKSVAKTTPRKAPLKVVWRRFIS